MNKAELIAAVAAAAEISKKDAETAVSATLDAITAALKEGDKVQLVGFGSFEVKSRAARDNGLVTVNGKPARASYEVKEGDQITLRFGVRTVTVEVLSVQETVRQSDAAALYRQIQ